MIRDGYKDFPLPGKGSPGTAVAFWPDLKNTDRSDCFGFNTVNLTFRVVFP